MDTNDHDLRLRNLEIICSAIPRIEKFMEDGAKLRAENSEKMGRIEQCVLGFKDYQIKCDKDRAEQEDHLSNADRRILAVEGFQKRQIKAAIGAGLFTGFLVQGGAKAITRMMDFFNG